MKKTLLIASIFLLAACSANVIRDTSNIDTNSSTYNTKIAMEHFISGQILDMKDKFDEAAQEYQKALEFDSSGGIYFTLAADYFRLNRLQPAEQTALKAVKSDTPNTDYYFLLAAIYESRRLTDSALACYKKVLQIDSLNTRAYFSLADLNKSGNPKTALEMYEKLIKIIGPTPEILFEIAAINESIGNTNRTIETLEELIKLNPSSIYLENLLAETCIKAKNYDKALKVINDVLTLYPYNTTFIQYKGQILMDQKKWGEAGSEYLKIITSPEIKYSDKVKLALNLSDEAKDDSTAGDYAFKIFQAIDKDTTDWQVKLHLAEIYSAHKKDSIAIQYYKKASELADWNVEIWVRYGSALFDKGQYQLLKTEMEKAYKYFPENYGVNLLYGLALSQTNKHLEAKPFLEKAVRFNPGDVMALSALGYTLQQLKQNDDALLYLNRVLDVDPNNIQALAITGLIYENKKDYANSDKMYIKALSLDSTESVILNNYAYSLSVRGINLDTALKMVKKALEKDPKNSSYLDTIGWIYFKMGDPKSAQKYIEDAIKNGEKSSSLYDHLGDVYLKLNKKDKALENWKKALKLEPENETIKLKIEKG